jgi:hypothetical protein
MLLLRLTQMKTQICELCFKMSQEHFHGDKEKCIYLINNYDFMYTQLKRLNVEKGIQDII